MELLKNIESTLRGRDKERSIDQDDIDEAVE